MKTWKYMSLVATTVIVGAWATLFAVVFSNGALGITVTPDDRFEEAGARGILSSVFNRRKAPEPVKIGDSRETVMQKLGSPEGEAGTQSRTTLFYMGGGIDLVDGHVVEIEGGFYRRSAAREQARRQADEMRAAGYVLYDGEWATPRSAKQRRRADQQNRLADQQQRRRDYLAIMRPKWTESTRLVAKTVKKPKPRYSSFNGKYGYNPCSSWYAPRKISGYASNDRYLPVGKYRSGTKYRAYTKHWPGRKVRDRSGNCWCGKRRGFNTGNCHH